MSGGKLTQINWNNHAFQEYTSPDPALIIFFVSKELVSKIKNCWYDCIVISDHTPISMSLKMEKLQQFLSNWCLQVKWLKNLEFVKYVEDKIDVYFQINNTQ